MTSPPRRTLLVGMSHRSFSCGSRSLRRRTHVAIASSGTRPPRTPISVTARGGLLTPYRKLRCLDGQHEDLLDGGDDAHEEERLRDDGPLGDDGADGYSNSAKMKTGRIVSSISVIASDVVAQAGEAHPRCFDEKSDAPATRSTAMPILMASSAPCSNLPPKRSSSASFCSTVRGWWSHRRPRRPPPCCGSRLVGVGVRPHPPG